MSASPVIKFIRNITTQERIESMLDERASDFTTSLVTAVNNNQRLADCTPDSVLNAALTAAALRLPISSALGFAALVPYGSECQFQIQWKGLVQLALRSNQYKHISATEVYEGQLISNDPLIGIVFDWSVKRQSNAQPAGYAAYIELLNGFNKTAYMSYEEVKDHALKYSKAYQWDINPKNTKGANSPWSTNFDAMAKKTVLKLLISGYGIISTDLEKALVSDQAVIRDDKPVYIDNDVLENERATEDEKKAIMDAHNGTNTPS